MSSIDASFDHRLRRLARKHRRMSENGVAAKVLSDGLVVPVPRRRLPRFPLKSVAILLGVAFVFKGWMLAAMGATAYDEKVVALQGGTLADQAAAWVMQADPATTWIAAQVRDLGLAGG